MFAVVVDDDEVADELNKTKRRQAGDDEVSAGGARVSIIAKE